MYCIECTQEFRDDYYFTFLLFISHAIFVLHDTNEISTSQNVAWDKFPHHCILVKHFYHASLTGNNIFTFYNNEWRRDLSPSFRTNITACVGLFSLR